VTWTGIDYNPVRVERARQAAPSATLHCGELAELDEGEKYHFVLLNQVIEHVHDDVGLLRQIARYLQPGGTLVVGTPNEGSLLQRVGERLRGSGPPTDHVQFYTEPVIRQRIESAGFTIDRVLREVLYVGVDPLYYWLTARAWGFRMLEFLARVIPSQCSDYYFECRLKGP
jgi:SAM-dependent methyltransferase